jgi:hypothetical protein
MLQVLLLQARATTQERLLLLLLLLLLLQVLLQELLLLLLLQWAHRRGQLPGGVPKGLHAACLWVKLQATRAPKGAAAMVHE